MDRQENTPQDTPNSAPVKKWADAEISTIGSHIANIINTYGFDNEEFVKFYDSLQSNLNIDKGAATNAPTTEPVADGMDYVLDSDVNDKMAKLNLANNSSNKNEAGFSSVIGNNSGTRGSYSPASHCQAGLNSSTLSFGNSKAQLQPSNQSIVSSAESPSQKPLLIHHSGSIGENRTDASLTSSKLATYNESTASSREAETRPTEHSFVHDNYSNVKSKQTSSQHDYYPEKANEISKRNDHNILPQNPELEIARMQHDRRQSNETEPWRSELRNPSYSSVVKSGYDNQGKTDIGTSPYGNSSEGHKSYLTRPPGFDCDQPKSDVGDPYGWKDQQNQGYSATQTRKTSNSSQRNTSGSRQDDTYKSSTKPLQSPSHDYASSKYESSTYNTSKNQGIFTAHHKAQDSRSALGDAITTQVANVSNNKNTWLQNTVKQSRRAKPSLNILVLGQTGVGKSTWINAFANYLIYNTLEEAIAAEAPICVIPTRFSMFDDDYQQREIVFGVDDNEVFSDMGQSATQNAKTYLLEHENFDLYIIDTPGMGDTRGKEEDNENLKKILRAIAPFKEIHAVCFLFKANDARMTPSFKYCIGKLLSNISRSTLDNACFIFTNARGTFYKPGDTMGPLKAYFRELRERENLPVSISDANTFCLDNEAFRFICAHFSKTVKFTPEQIKSFSDSWTHSAKEVSRLVAYAAQMRPHNTADMLSVNETRTWIYQLVKPTVEISNLIQSNLQALHNRINELKSMEYSIEELQKRTAVPIVTLVTRRLDSPRTVCTHPRCVSFEKISGQVQTLYTTVCHDPCHLPNVNPEKVPDPALKGCAALGKKGGCCYECGCSWRYHMRIFYEQYIETNRVEHQAMINQLSSTTDASKIKKEMIQKSKRMIDEYDKEMTFILNCMAMFSTFLSQNGISQHADVFETYMINLIETEEAMIKNIHQYDDRKYNQLAHLLSIYRDVRQQCSSKAFSLHDIHTIQQKLFALPLTGPKISELFSIHVEADKSDYAESIVHCKKESVIKTSMNYLKSVYSTIKNSLFS